MARRLPLFAVLAILLTSCRNDCQHLCREMARLYEDCGYEASQAQVRACMDDYAEPDDETLSSCTATVGQLEETLAQKAEDGDACSELESFNSRQAHSGQGKYTSREAGWLAQALLEGL